MRAVVIHETGDPTVLRLQELDRPEPGEGQVLIGVHAASVNPIDWKYRRGMMPKDLPAVLGSDVSGVVVRSRAEGFSEGDEVFGFAASGAYAEFATAPVGVIAHKPAGLSHEQAAAIPVAGLTAWQALFDRGELGAGQTALIAGAAGGVGHLAVQLAKHAGAHTVAIGSTRNRDYAMGLGAERYIDYTAEDVGEAAQEVDLAFDTVGGANTEAMLATVRRGGALITIASPPPELAATRGVKAELLIMSANSDQLAKVAELIAAGDIRVEIAETLPLEQIAHAHELSESGHTRGKIVLSVSSAE